MSPEELRRGVLQRFAQLLIIQLIEGAMLFLAAGTLRFRGGWLFLGASVAGIVANGIYVLPRNPEIVVERGRRHEGTRSFDKIVLVPYTVFLFGTLIVAGLDAVRFRWAPIDPRWALPGLVLMALGTVPIAGAMAANRNLEPTVRIQSDRGHTVARTGPYRFVRHPMYAGTALTLLGMPLVLGSGWAMAPALATLVTLVVRTALEDRALRRDLPGYEDYASETRYRLLPGVW